MTRNEILQTAVIAFIIFSVYFAIQIVVYSIKNLIGWMYRNGYWFPKTVKEIREERITEMKKYSDEVDSYVDELEKQSSGIFK